jgi:hypothetical protein
MPEHPVPERRSAQTAGASTPLSRTEQFTDDLDKATRLRRYRPWPLSSSVQVRMSQLLAGGRFPACEVSC